MCCNKGDHTIIWAALRYAFTAFPSLPSHRLILFEGPIISNVALSVAEPLETSPLVSTDQPGRVSGQDGLPGKRRRPPFKHCTMIVGHIPESGAHDLICGMVECCGVLSYKRAPRNNTGRGIRALSNSSCISGLICGVRFPSPTQARKPSSSHC